MHKRALTCALNCTLFAAALATTGAAQAASPATGVWVDHTGRGAVEITECGANLCGRLVWVKDATNKKGCGLQIIGNVKPVGKDTWDGGWIYDPDRNAKYSVELKTVGADKLRVVGYMGSKMFSETMIWKRPTTELERCDKAEPASATVTPPPKKADEPAAPAPKEKPASAEKGKAKASAEKGKAKKETAAPTECKKYISQIGQMITVPCEPKRR